ARWATVTSAPRSDASKVLVYRNAPSRSLYDLSNETERKTTGLPWYWTSRSHTDAETSSSRNVMIGLRFASCEVVSSGFVPETSLFFVAFVIQAEGKRMRQVPLSNPHRHAIP